MTIRAVSILVCEELVKVEILTMIATTRLPDDFELREGEEFDFHAVALNGSLVVTPVIRTAPLIPEAPRTSKAGFAAKWGRSMAKIEDPNDDRLTPSTRST